MRSVRIIDLFIDICEGKCFWLRTASAIDYLCDFLVMADAESTRIFHLDAIRAILMLFGILTHATMIGSHAVFDMVTAVSGLFRMKAFFLISGFFGALLLAKRGTGAFWATRLPSLLWPLATGIVVIVPLTLWLMALWFSGPISPRAWLSDQSWLETFPAPVGPLMHLWFLVVLIVFTLALPMLMVVLKSRPVALVASAMLLGAKRWGLWGHVLLISTLMMASRGLFLALFGRGFDGGEFGWIVAMVFQYAPWFGFGALAFHYRPLFDVFGSVSLAHVAGGLLLCCGMFALASWLVGGWPAPMAKAIYWISRSAIVVFGFAGLVRICRRWFDRETPLLRLLVDSALTFYLLHIALIFLVVNLAGRETPGLGWLYMLAVLLVPPLAIWLHVVLVTRSAVLQLLLSGKSRASTPVPAFQ